MLPPKIKGRIADCCLAGLAAVLATACNKQTDATAHQCHIIAMNDSGTNQSSSVTTYRYDDAGRLLEVVDGGDRTRFMYNGQWMYAERSGASSSRDTTLLRPDGSPLWFRIWFNGGNRSVLYEYDAAGQLKSMYSKEEKGGSYQYDTADFAWESGNVVRQVSSRPYGSADTTYFGYYSDKEAQPADALFWSQYRYLGFAHFRTRNLLKSEDNYNHRYVFNEQGRIVADTILRSPLLISYFLYDCP